MRLASMQRLIILFFIGLSVAAKGQTAPGKEPYTLDPAIFDQNVEAKKAALAQIRQRLIDDTPHVSLDWKQPTRIDAFLASLDDKGQFTDLNHPKPPLNWGPAMHRLNAIAAAYHRIPALRERAGLKNRLFLAIDYYCRDVVKHPDPFVGAAFEAPRDAAVIYYSLYSELAEPGMESVRQSVKDAIFSCWYNPQARGSTRKSDPFTVDVFRHDNKFMVGNFTYRPVIECAVALQSTKMLDVIRAVTEFSLANRTSFQTESESLWDEQGLLYDGGGFAHGRQSYMYGYVRDYFLGVGQIAHLFSGTPWQINSGSWNLLANHILDGQQWFIYHGDIDWSIAGRHNMYPGPIFDGNNLLRTAIKQVLDYSDGTVKRKDELLALGSRIDAGKELVGNRYFWNSEDMVHRGPGFYLAVNLCSVRSNGPESVAPFSVVNYHMPFGSMMIKTAGDEYLVARGAINYSALPGTTSDPTAPLPAEETWSGFSGLNEFCGGVSDGSVGACGFIQKQKEFTATGNKSYFFFNWGLGGGGMVALGAGISGTHLETTINQTQWRGPVVYGEDAAPNLIDSAGQKLDLPVHHAMWIHHDGVGYIVLPATNAAHVKIVAEIRQTRWAELAKKNAGDPLAAPANVPILQMSIPHDADNDAYAYAVMPTATAKSIADAAKSPPFVVLANTKQVQAVQFPDARMIQAVFFEPGKIRCVDGELSVDRPAVVMLRQHDGKWELSVSDPLQRPDAGKVRVETTLPGISGGRTNPLQISCTLPAAPWIGSAAHQEIAAR